MVFNFFCLLPIISYTVFNKYYSYEIPERASISVVGDCVLDSSRTRSALSDGVCERLLDLADPLLLLLDLLECTECVDILDLPSSRPDGSRIF